MNLVFVPLFGHAGLALSVGLGALVNAALAASSACAAAAGSSPRRAGAGSRCAVGIATLLMGGLLYAAQTRIDWVGLAGREWLRIGWLAACLGGCRRAVLRRPRPGGLQAARFLASRLGRLDRPRPAEF